MLPEQTALTLTKYADVLCWHRLLLGVIGSSMERARLALVFQINGCRAHNFLQAVIWCITDRTHFTQSDCRDIPWNSHNMPYSCFGLLENRKWEKLILNLTRNSGHIHINVFFWLSNWFSQLMDYFFEAGYSVQWGSTESSNCIKVFLRKNATRV